LILPVQEAPSMFELIVQSGKQQGKSLRLPSEGDVLIGRGEDCQIRLASNDVSRHHCMLRLTPEGIVARDLDSRNGSFLNETLMDEETLLKPGDILRVGPISLQVPGSAPIPERGASDDDIANWLAVNEGIAPADGVEANSGDTTIIPRRADLEKAISQVPPPPRREAARETSREPARDAGRDTARQFRSVAEEAADIIRRHWEMVKSQREG
jgi:hypothetical protein